VADLTLLEKVQQAKSINPNIEIGWDGGVNAENVRQLADAGVDIINSGGYIHRAPDPALAYHTLVKLLP
jgi:ribulose-phosphate 3-epimerase